MSKPTLAELQEENLALRQRLEEAEAVLHAISTDGVDAVVVQREGETQVRMLLQEAESALRDREDQLQLAKGAAQLGIQDYDLQSGRIQWDERAGDLWGIDPSAPLTIAAVVASVHPDDQAGFHAALTRARASPRDARYSAQFRVISSRDKKSRWIEANGKVFFNAGRAVRLIHTVQDITVRKLSEVTLRDSEQQLRALADTLPQLAWTARPDGSIEWYNQRWYEYTGTTPEQVEGWGWQSVHDPAVLPQVMDAYQKSLITGVPFDMVFPLRGADGVFRSFLTRTMPLRDEQGRIVRWIGTNTDISAQLALETALRVQDRRKDEFLATLAHELRGPLAPLSSMLEVMELADADVVQRKSARQTMQRQLGHLVRLVDDLLDVSRITRDKLSLRKQCLELAPIIQQAVETCRAAVQDAGHKLEFDLPNTPIHLDADAVRLVQIFSNLIHNACKYTDPGGRIAVTVKREDNEVRVSVKDSGIGIPADKLRSVFELFVQVDRALERAQGGLGIGLTLVQRLVSMHGGAVRAYSEGAGAGSEFVVTLPVLAESSDVPAVAPSTTDETRSARRILVVDDNRDSALSMARLLKIVGHEVRTVHDGLEAVQAAEDYRPEVVLLDIGLPQLNGYEVCEAIRRQPWGQDMTIIAISGWGQDSDRQKSKEAGFDGHLIKPVAFTDLKRLLAQPQRA